MNRLIKFRALDALNKNMLAHQQVIFGTFEIDNIIGLDEDDWEFPKKMNLLSMFLSPCKHHYKLMQFTGLHDQNGKEIYEGDILLDDMFGWKYSISWDDLLFAFILNNDESKTWIFLHEINEDINCYEVIGNIHEHPELLNNGKD